MYTQRKVFVVVLQRLQTCVGAHSPLKIAFDTTHTIMLFTNAIYRKVDNNLTGGSSLQDALDATGDNLILDAIGRNVNDARTTMPRGCFNHLWQVFAQRR